MQKRKLNSLGHGYGDLLLLVVGGSRLRRSVLVDAGEVEEDGEVDGAEHGQQPVQIIKPADVDVLRQPRRPPLHDVPCGRAPLDHMVQPFDFASFRFRKKVGTGLGRRGGRPIYSVIFPFWKIKQI